RTHLEEDGMTESGATPDGTGVRALFVHAHPDDETITTGGTLAALTGAGERPSGDRKSTRLNSSHVSISYAVFCLKKKKHSGTHVTSFSKSSMDVPSLSSGIDRVLTVLSKNAFPVTVY